MSTELVPVNADVVGHKAQWEHEELAKVRVQVFRGHTDSVNSCQFFDNDNFILTCGSDRSVKVWMFGSGKIRANFNNIHKAAINEACATNDGVKFVSCGWDKLVQVFDTETGRLLWKGDHSGVVTCCKVSHDRKYVCSGSDMDNRLKIWDTFTGELLHDLQDHHESTITSCIFSPKDDKVITTSMDKTTKFFDLKSCKTTLTLRGHLNVVSKCSISADERKFATASWDKMVHIWDVATGTFRSKGPATLKGIHEGSVSSCDFSKDGLLLVTGSYDQTVVLWDADDLVKKLKLQGHSDWVNDVKISDDRRWLLSCSRDQTVRLWNIENCDRIPMVMETRKSVGLNVTKCTKCGKPFSMATVDSFRDMTVCVFCRLHNPGESWLPISEVDEGSQGRTPALSETDGGQSSSGAVSKTPSSSPEKGI